VCTAASTPALVSIPIPAGTTSDRPSTTTRTSVWVWVAVPSWPSSGTCARAARPASPPAVGLVDPLAVELEGVDRRGANRTKANTTSAIITTVAPARPKARCLVEAAVGPLDSAVGSVAAVGPGAT
jgi:hypothetical protein